MPNQTIYTDLLDIITAHKSVSRTEQDTELFVERMCNIIDEHYVNNELTQEQYDALYLALPK